LKKLPIQTKDGQLHVLNYQQEIQTSLMVHPQGITYQQMRRYLDLSKKIEDANGHVDLSPPEFSMVTGALTSQAFRVISPELIDFIDSVVNTPIKSAEMLAKSDADKRAARAVDEDADTDE
jgi:hypothetical protein